MLPPSASVWTTGAVMATFSEPEASWTTGAVMAIDPADSL